MRGRNVISFRTLVQTRSVLSFIAAACVVVAAACQSTPPPTGIGVEARNVGKLAEKNPVDIAIAPVRNTAGRDVPAAELRMCFHKGLVARRYSPLALPFVDRNVVDAAYPPGSSNEQAVMEISVEKWDTALWSTHGAISTRMNVRMLDASSGEELWSGRVDQRFDFGRAVDAMPTEGLRMHHACESIAAAILEKLPARNAQFAP
jgi:hypothetical protein